MALLAAFALPLFVVADDISLTWTPPPNANITTIDHYTVYWGTSSHSYIAQRVSNTNSITITGLNRGDGYYFAVTATDLAGLETDPSVETKAWVGLSTQTFNIPLGLTELGVVNVRLESSTNLTNWDMFTSWQQVRQPNEFYRLSFQKR